MITLKEAYILITKAYATLMSDVSNTKLFGRHSKNYEFKYKKNLNPEYDLFHGNKKQQINKENKKNNLILKNNQKYNYEK